MVSVASLASVRLTGAAPPSAGTAKMSRLVDSGSIRPASRSAKNNVLPSALQAISSAPPKGLDGLSPTSAPMTDTALPPDSGITKICERWPSDRSEEHTSELQSLMHISYAVFCLKKKTNTTPRLTYNIQLKERTTKRRNVTTTE